MNRFFSDFHCHGEYSHWMIAYVYVVRVLNVHEQTFPQFHFVDIDLTNCQPYTKSRQLISLSIKMWKSVLHHYRMACVHTYVHIHILCVSWNKQILIKYTVLHVYMYLIPLYTVCMFDHDWNYNINPKSPTLHTIHSHMHIIVYRV